MSKECRGCIRMTQTGILFFHNFWIFHLWDHFWAKKLGKGERGRGEWIKVASHTLCACAILCAHAPYSVRIRHTLCACTILCAHAPYSGSRFWKSKSKSFLGNCFFGNRNRNRFLEIVFWKSKSQSKSILEIEIEIKIWKSFFGNRNRNRDRFWKSKSKSKFGNRFLEIEIEIGFGNRNHGNRNRNRKSIFLEPKSIMPTSVFITYK